MTKITLNELEKLAKCATPGPWHSDENIIFAASIVAGSTGQIAGTDELEVEEMGFQLVDATLPSVENATFIAAVNPQTILDLIADLRACAEALKSYRVSSAVKHPQVHERGDEALKNLQKWGL